ncbi:hypothetical protein JX265_010375 [Neoarthrinium moseri]|uniref:Glycosyl transferase n=1 Tax=Neoarthrinium moseri TaxID=1658444 RepID=A0A9P9WE15_9PEZI|nr:hypothetical protein JX265_010375 [Neoarthrinium moseri]
MELPRWLVPPKSRFQKARWVRLSVSVGCSVAALFFIRALMNNDTLMLPSVSYRRPPIPNIVHYTMMMRDELSEFDINFVSFLSVYSALRMLKAPRIYIHTDFNETMIRQAREEGSKWTRKLLNDFPEIIMNHVPVITHANGKEITAVEHRSDMVRFNQIYDKGGLYLDFDVYALRDARVLREAGFNNVVGRQADGGLNNGCFMSRPKSALAYIMKRDQWTTFDGGWLTHSVVLLTQISERLVKSPGEVLILDQLAMAPWGWGDEDHKRMYLPHKDTVPQFPQVNDPTEDPMARWQDRVRGNDWELDFSSTYFLHAFRPHGGSLPGFDGVSVKYILERNSNFALATWHIVQIGLKEGVFVEDDNEI